MTDPLKVVVCDDDAERVVDWAQQIEEVVGDRGVTRALAPVEFAEAVESLKSRRASGSGQQDDAAAVFDDADVLILDSDLTPDSYSGAEEVVRTQLTSEMGGEIAHLARGYTTAGAIVVVNEGTQQRTFDLTLMKRSMAVADLYVSEDDVANPHLWGATQPGAPPDFYPSLWPRLDLLPGVIAEAVSTVELDQPWVRSLALDGTTWDELHDGQLESLGVVTSGDVDELTFREMAEHRILGLRRKETTTDDLRLRVAVCGLRRWLERVLLPAQNVSVDLPHLMQSHPWLVHDREDLGAWNAVEGRWSTDPDPLALEAFHERLSTFLGRNVWLVGLLEPRPAGARVLASDPVYCEDLSRFLPVDEAKDFLSDVEGPFARRFVSDVGEAEYMPRNRLAV